jgi:hypothetical protein
MMIIKCDADCNHGCNLHAPDGEDLIEYALREMWVVQMWNTPHGYGDHVHGPDHPHDDLGNDKHAMVFCDALCAFTHLRRRLMTAQDPYPERLRLLEQMEPAW